MGKSFAWSHSRLSGYELCPKRHKLVDLDKKYDEGPKPAMEFGSDLHKALEEYTRDGTPMPPDMKPYKHIGDKVRALPGDKLYECKLALSPEFEPVSFFARNVWFRCVVDVLVLDSAYRPKRGAAVDYKTGKIKNDPAQLMLNAAAIFAHYPTVETVDTRYWWLTKGETFTSRTYLRAELPEIWNKFLPRAKRYQQAVETGKFPANPGGLCRKWCPVTECEFHGGGSR